MAWDGGREGWFVRSVGVADEERGLGRGQIELESSYSFCTDLRSPDQIPLSQTQNPSSPSLPHKSLSVSQIPIDPSSPVEGNNDEVESTYSASLINFLHCEIHEIIAILWYVPTLISSPHSLVHSFSSPCRCNVVGEGERKKTDSEIYEIIMNQLTLFARRKVGVLTTIKRFPIL